MKKINYKIQVLSKATLTESFKEEIYKLKQTHYKYSLISQKNWFNKYINAHDMHILLFKDSKVIGYNVLKIRKLKVVYKQKKIEQNCYLFDTLVINPSLRNQGLSKLIMNKSNLLIKNRNYFSVLVCLNNLVNYYKKFNWSLLPKNKIIFSENLMRNNKKVMVYGKKFNLKKIIRIEVIYNE